MSIFGITFVLNKRDLNAYFYVSLCHQFSRLSLLSPLSKRFLFCSKKCEFSAATFIVDYVFVKNTTAIKRDQTIDGSDDF